MIMRSGQYKVSCQQSHHQKPKCKKKLCFTGYQSRDEESPSASTPKLKSHRSCENVNSPEDSSAVEEPSKCDLQYTSQSVDENKGWQVGKIVTVTKSGHMRGCLSQSSWHALGSNEGTMSSGYSSCTSSSYGSFKSSVSDRELSKSPENLFARSHYVQNPLYDAPPSTSVNLKSIDDAVPIYKIPPLDRSQSTQVSPEHQCDILTNKCKNFFQRRKIRPHFLHPPTTASLHPNPATSSHLGQQLAFLRNQIVLLMRQDEQLLDQLLALHSSISHLKATNALQHTQRPHPSSYSISEREVNPGHNSYNEEEVMFESYCTKPPRLVPDEEDEGHGTDVSHDHMSSFSSSPASTISSNSSKSSSTRMGILEQTLYECPSESPSSTGFTRSRKSYAPTARNRTRSLSAHAHKPPCDTQNVSAIVIVHTQDEELFFPKTPKTKLPKNPSSHTHKDSLEALVPASLRSKSSCSRQSSHPPTTSRYREALIM